MENLFHFNNLMLFLLAAVCLLLTISGTSAAGSQTDEVGHGPSAEKIPFYAEHCVHGDKSGNFQLDYVYKMGFYYHDKAYPDWFCGGLHDESYRKSLEHETGKIEPELKFNVKLENSEEEFKFEYYKAEGLSFVKPAPQMFMRILTFVDEFFFAPNGKSMDKEEYLQMWNSVKHLNSPVNSSQEEIKAHLPPAVRANPPPPALQIPVIKPPPGQSSARKSLSPFATNPVHSSSSSQAPHSFDSSSSGTSLHSDRQSPSLHMVVHSSARSHAASTDFDFSPESESNYASECNDGDHGHWEHSDGTRAYPDWFCLDAEKAKDHSEALSNECSEIAITSSRIFWVANGNRNEIYYHYESKEMACIVPTPRKFVAFNGRGNKMYFFGPNGKEISESEFLKMASHVNTMPLVLYKTSSTGKKTGKSMGNFFSFSSFGSKGRSTPKEQIKTPHHGKEKSTPRQTPKEEQITESPSNWLDQREFLDMLEYKPSNLDRNLAYHITDKQIKEFREHRPKFNVYVNNGEQSIAPSEQNYDLNEQIAENHYPLSEAQLRSGLNQFLMNERFIAAKQWHKKLEEVFDMGKNHLKTLFDKDGKLLTREQIIHNSFYAATGLVNADSTDLIEILVTAHNDEKPTSDEKTEEMIRKGIYESKLPCEELNNTSMEIKGVFKQILKALCENQRDLDFDINPAQINEDKAVVEQHFAKKNNDDAEIIKIFTTRNYSHLREMFSRDSKLRPLIEGTEEKDNKPKAKFNKVIVAILKDALDGRPKFFAELLHEKLGKLSEKGFTQKLHHADAHKDVQRILATRAQIDLMEIAEVYNAEYGPLFDDLKGLELKAYTDIVKEASGLEFTTDDAESSQN